MDDLFLEDLGEKIGLQNKTMKIRGAFSSIIWKDHHQAAGWNRGRSRERAGEGGGGLQFIQK